jgi:hypothetical protein
MLEVSFVEVNRMKTTNTLIGVLAVTLLTTAAAANDPASDEDQSKRTAEQKFEALDRNDDKRLSWNEVQSEQTLSAEFGSVDADSDGYVTKSEYTAKMDTRQPHRDHPRGTEGESYR